ncbi:aerotolerance protein [Pontibacter arcticus]|uniref:Aerotolerance protein n=1 Tax=Pontibacter arcticus TaxID=2080288 RepID=A0A364RE48_9BACT|nr:aerotolerance protein [Pontibacter arcticus]RAU82618.1 aerotolerance protein [Pontibacter arcticus]
MKLLLYGILLISLFSGGLNTITKINQYAKQAAADYKRADYLSAITTYNYLLYDLEVEDDQLQLNLAHAYYRSGQMEKAQQEYQLLADHPSSHLRAVVHLQLGNIASTQHKYKYALALYKQALIVEPSNETARYNYELLKKYLELHPEKAQDETAQNQPEDDDQSDSLAGPPPAADELQPQPKKNPDDQGTEEEETDTPAADENGTDKQPGGTSENQQAEKEREEKSGRNPGDELGQNPDSNFDPNQPQKRAGAESITENDTQAQTQSNLRKQPKLSPDKAKLLLDAMRNVELQYLQQLPKKATKKPDPSLPDW